MFAAAEHLWISSGPDVCFCKPVWPPRIGLFIGAGDRTKDLMHQRPGLTQWLTPSSTLSHRAYITDCGLINLSLWHYLFGVCQRLGTYWVHSNCLSVFVNRVDVITWLWLDVTSYDPLYGGWVHAVRKRLILPLFQMSHWTPLSPPDSASSALSTRSRAPCDLCPCRSWSSGSISLETI